MVVDFEAYEELLGDLNVHDKLENNKDHSFESKSDIIWACLNRQDFENCDAGVDEGDLAQSVDDPLPLVA